MKSSYIVYYLNKLYYSKYIKKKKKITKEEIGKEEIKWIKKYISDNTKKFIFMNHHSGPYCKSLERNISLNGKHLKKIDPTIFGQLYFTWKKNNNLTKEQHYKFNRAILIPVYKKGDINKPSNYRYLYNFSNNVKLLDKIWSFEICKELTGKINNINFLSYHIRNTFNKNLKEVATRFTNNSDNKIMLDFEKAFDSVSFYTIEQLLKSFLIRVLGKEKGEMYFERYFNLIINCNIYYDKIKIKRNKGIPTGLSSSNLIFTMIMEQIFYLFDKICPSFKKYFNFYVYVDDIAINVLDNSVDISSYIKKLMKVFEYYKFKCNNKKCLISKNIHNQIDNFTIIENNTKYLGIYFCRNPEEYINLIIDEFNKKKNQKFKTIYDMVKYNKNSARGFLKYKLHPFLKN